MTSITCSVTDSLGITSSTTVDATISTSNSRPYENLTRYYKFPTGSVTFPDVNSAHMQVKSGDHASWDSGCDFAGLSGLNGEASFPTGANIHIDYYFRVAAGAALTGSWTLVGEIHNDDIALGRATSPPYALHIGKDKMMVVAIAGGSSKAADKWMWLYTDPNPLLRDHDYHMAIDVRFTTVGGYLRVKRDGQSIVDYSGPMGYGAPTYWMPDIYRSASSETIIVDYSRMQVWTD